MRLQLLCSTLQLILICLIYQSKGHVPPKQSSIQPNIVVIMADDLGWYDISLHGLNQFYTPNIDALAIHGITLNSHYVPPMCTPSRAAFLTGKYPINTGMQHSVIVSDEPWGLPLENKLLPEYLKDAGYHTHLIGKWHLGFFKEEYTPCQRGFDSFFGYYNGYIDYWDHNLYMVDRSYSRGYDMRSNETLDYSNRGIYATDLFNRVAVDTIQGHDKNKPLFLLVNHIAGHTGNEDDPMQAPESEIKKFDYIQNTARRTYAAMVSKLDKSVGEIVEALNSRDMLDNTIILFYSDNGAPTLGMHENTGSNFPFRGMKDSPWEGAVHGLAAVFSPLLKARQRISNQLMHVTDWFTTFVKLAGIDTTLTTTTGIDGFDMWSTLSEDLPSPRQEVVHVIDDIWNYAAYTNGKFKYVEGTRSDGKYDGWLGLIPFNETIERVNTSYANAIRNSLVGQALAKYVLDSMAVKENSLSDIKINDLRQQATITCLEPPPINDNLCPCNPLEAPCLFNIRDDPCEYCNIAEQYPEKLERMKNMVQGYRDLAVTPQNLPSDPRADPAFYNNTWTWWCDVE